MFNITTGYPTITGDYEKDFKSLHSAFGSLIDELSYVVPQLSKQVDAISMPVTDEGAEENT